MGASFPEAKVEPGRHLATVTHDFLSSRVCNCPALTTRPGSQVSGGYIGGVLPVPIPNTEVKPSRADGTARPACGRVGRCRNFSPRRPAAPPSRGASPFPTPPRSRRKDCTTEHTESTEKTWFGFLPTHLRVLR